MIRLHTTITKFDIANATEVEVGDILDAVRTLRPSSRIDMDIAAPGRGPDFFVQWCKAELDEAESVEEGPIKARKSFNVVVLAKCAVECLVDWYLSRHLLQLTIGRTAGLVQKLNALNAEELLGIGLSLFDDNLFGPRNTAIHNYEPVDFEQAKKAYQLANLTVQNCKTAVPPNVGPVFYGNLKIARDGDVQQYAENELKLGDSSTAFYFGGLTDDERNGVFFHRNGRKSRVALLSGTDNGTEVRFAAVSSFSPEEILELIAHLESTSPASVQLSADELETVLNSFLGLNGRAASPAW